MKNIVLLLLLVPAIVIGQTKKMINFSFTLPTAATVSAGVYKGDVLIRTLFSNRKYSAGLHKENYEALDDEMQPINSAEGLKVKVLSNNVKYEWEGVIGNTSDSATGNSVYHNYGPFTSLAFAGNFGYYTVGYNERKPSFGKFNISKPNQRIVISEKHIQADYVATDGKIVYWASSDPYDAGSNLILATSATNDEEVKFQSGESYTSKKISSKFASVVGSTKKDKGKISGIAVQKKGNYLFISRKDLNQVDVFDKADGKQLFTIDITAPGIMNVDAADKLWLITNNNIQQLDISSDGNYKVNKSIGNFSAVSSFAISPDNKVLIAIDKGTSQLKAFNPENEKQLWVYGKAGGYFANGPDVTTDKFYFKDLQNDFKTFVAFEPDGTFWVSDPGNTRVLHFNADIKFINSIAYRPISYSTFTDLNNPSRVFSDYCEYYFDYSKNVSPKNGSWKLAKNWGAVIPRSLADAYGRLKNVATLKNGRTYAIAGIDRQKNSSAVLELPATGNIRMAGEIAVGYDLYKDGSLRRCDGSEIGSSTTWKKRDLVSFTSEGNPVWGEEKTIAKSPPLTGLDPAPRNIRSMAEITSSGILIAYEGATPGNGTKNGKLSNRSNGFHLGGIKINEDGKWLWRTAYSTLTNYSGEFPDDGSFDIGNGVVRTGDVKHYAVDRFIIFGQHGEFWKGSQVNKWNVFYDNGLMIGQFGVTGPSVANQQAPYGMAGNSFTGSAINVNGDIFLTHNDEGFHSGVHVWKISNLSSAKEQTVPLSISAALPYKNEVLLMKGLPHDRSLSDGDGEWHRYPEKDDLTDKYKQFWQVRTNAKTYDRFDDPDIFISFRLDHTNATVSRDLGKNDAENWKITGDVNYEGNYPSVDINKRGEDGSGGQFLELLDNNGKIIFRFYPQLDNSTNKMRIIANNTTVIENNQQKMQGITGAFQPLSLKMNYGKTLVQYAGFPEKAITLFDPSANYRSPATLRLYFWANGKNASRIISIKDFKFIKS